MSSDEVIEESGTIRLSDQMWSEARRRAEIIAPIAKHKNVSISIAKEAAQKLGLSERTIYNLVKLWKETGGSVPALAPRTSDGGRGGTRISKDIESIISIAIAETYLTRQKCSVSVLMRTVKERCRKSNLAPPALNTIRSRINRLKSDYVLQKRQGKDASNHLKPLEGHFPETNGVLDVVQIDHTLVDLIIVDLHTRLPIGRLWITVAIDVYSRCIIGFCLTLEPPSAVSVGLCLAHIAIDKRPWLEQIGVDADWPMSGKPKAIYVDNGKEFHSEALRRGCDVHGIQISYRPVKTPHYGGIIERVIGTLMKMVHEIPGTTFSNITEKGEYNSEKYASLTLSELEKWFVSAIMYYHSSLHSGIGESPITRWNRSLNSREEPFKVNNSKAFLIDFLPIVYRRIQRQGFVIDHITYMSPTLKLWINEKDKDYTFVIRRDPRDLSRIYVLHPEESHYVEVPYRTFSNPAVTLWEHKFAIRKLKENGKQQIDEDSIFKTIQTMREITQNAVYKTKSARRNAARVEHLESSSNDYVLELPIDSSSHSTLSKPLLFDEIEEWSYES